MKKSFSFFVFCLFCFAHGKQAIAASTSEAITSLAHKCSPDVSPLTMYYIVEHESASDPYRINTNGKGNQLEQQPKNEREAVAAAKALLKANKNIDMGLGQINSANLNRLGLTVEDIFKPCINLRATQTILKACYDIALKSYAPGQEALKHALSCYNTGSQNDGISNGYVTKIINVATQSDLKIPTLLPDGNEDAPAASAESQQTNADNSPSYDGESDAFNASASKDAFALDNTDAFLAKKEQKKGE